MEQGFRASMNWLHTWAGVVLGGLLFAIFWMGTLAVFDREIDRWMAPMIRLPAAEKPFSLESLRPLYETAAAAKSPFFSVGLPTDRDAAIRVLWSDQSGQTHRFIDPNTGAVLPDPGTLAGTRFIFPFHYMLHIRAENIGYWLVGLAAMAMMALCVSGVIIHRKIFTDFFTFRPDRKPRRLVLDLHNVTGVLGWPFHFLITLSGLVIFWSTYFPSAWQLTYNGDRLAFFADAYGNVVPKGRSGESGGMASFDAMASEARRVWDGSALRYVFVRNPGDAKSIVQIGRLDEGIVSSTYDAAYFDGPTGALISYKSGTAPVMSVQRFLAGFHFIQFRHWSLRWIYFGLGLTGCVLIATGYLFWLESRRKKHAQLGLKGVRIVEGLAVGSVTGMLIATAAFFVANRLLPLGAEAFGLDRAALEVWTFYLVWLATFAHAWARPQRAWMEQCWTVAALACAAALLNWITTGDHLVRSLSYRHLWPIAGMDILLLAGSAIAAVSALRLSRPSRVARVRHA
jgi:uncharacterized iron-regulated membrane protein